MAVAAFLKGAVGFGFPALATPALALASSVSAAVAVLVIPNLVMDGIQIVRGGGALATIRRFWPLVLAGMVGTVVGTHLLFVLPPRVALAVLGAFMLAFVTVNLTPVALRVPPAREVWLGPLAGLVGGLVGGVTNVPGPPILMYFFSLGLPKREFVRSASLVLWVYKLTQLGAVVWWGLLTWRRLAVSLALVTFTAAAFVVGLRVQDRLDQRVFQRAALAVLGALGCVLLGRALLG